MLAAQVQEYLESYADNFGLYDHVRFNTKVTKVVRNKNDTKWEVHLSGDNVIKEMIEFDKVAICTNAYVRPKIPEFQGRTLYTGRVVHSQAFKR
jgi:dimethylaniline monooxygenase (N-oxide forming)